MKKRLIIALIIALALMLSACGGGVVQTIVVTQIVEGEVVEVPITIAPAQPEPADYAADEAADEEDYALPDTDSIVDEEEMMDEEISVGSDESNSVSDTNVSDNSSVTNEGGVLPQERMIIKNAEMSLFVDNVDVAVGLVEQVAVDNKGYILSTSAWSDGDQNHATMTIAVQSDLFEVAMRRLRNLAIEVISEEASGQDVSEEFVDLQSRLRNLETTRDRVEDFMERAATLDQALEISKELAEIEGQIEQVKGRMNFLSGRAAVSTITVSMKNPVFIPTPTPTLTPTLTPTPTMTPTLTPTLTPTPWSPIYAVNEAVNTQSGMLQGLTDSLLWLLIVLLPYAIVIGIIVIIGRRIYYRLQPPQALSQSAPVVSTAPSEANENEES